MRKGFALPLLTILLSVDAASGYMYMCSDAKHLLSSRWEARCAQADYMVSLNQNVSSVDDI